MEMDLKYCRRTELIDLITTQRRTIEMLKSENAVLKSRLEEAGDNAAQSDTPSVESNAAQTESELPHAEAPAQADENPAPVVETPAADPITESTAEPAKEPAEPAMPSDAAAALAEVLRRLDTMQSEDARRAHELERENAELRAQLEQLKTATGEPGNLAEAALSISGVFESAQRAAEHYLTGVKNARSDADNILSSAHEQAEKIEREAQEKATAREHAAEESIRTKEAEFRNHCTTVVSSYEALRNFVQGEK